jgi:diaminopimelate decarboxylase
MQRDEGGRALAGGRPIAEVLAEAGVPTPVYVYDVGAMVREADALAGGFHFHRHMIAYAIKANSGGPIVRALAESGCGAEVGSRGELEVALNCSVAPEAVLLSGVGKSDADIDAAIGVGDWGICAIQIDAIEEVARIEARARAQSRVARVALRLNPGVEADTHEHIATGHDEAKFGIPIEELGPTYEALRGGEHLLLVGMGCHVGSQLTRTDEYLKAGELLFDAARAYESAGGARLELLDLGGGFGIDYGDGCPVKPADFAHQAVERVKAAGFGDRLLVVEPGRALTGAHGVLVSSVVTRKRASGRDWLVIDAGMNDLLRPALYRARHRIEPLDCSPTTAGSAWHVVGPVCESSDDFGAWPFEEPAPERVVLRDAGAYGFTMASNYNGRGLPAEVFVMPDGRILASQAGDARTWAAERITIGLECRES